MFRPASRVAVTLVLGALSCALAAVAHAAPNLDAAHVRVARWFARRDLAYPPRAVTLVALKAEGRLELWAQGDVGWTFVRSYLVRATSGRLGPKLRQGDKQVPEGHYQVSALNPRSRYHLSLRLDYPNAFDAARASEDGRTRLGSDIMIHGDRVSVGCLPVGDQAIEELYTLAAQIGVENVSVVISPVDLRRIDPAVVAQRVPRRPAWLEGLYADIARTLAVFPLAETTEGGKAAPKLRLAGAPKCRPYDLGDCERQCRAGDLASCTRAGVLYGDGRGGKRDGAKAWTLLADACARGDAVGCAALSELVIDDDGFRRDASRAQKLARDACEAGDGHGCARLAQLCTDRLIYPDKPDGCSEEQVDLLRKRAVSQLSSSCSGWAAYDCVTLASIYGSGDFDTALRFAQGSCEAGDPAGCDQLGALYEGRGELANALRHYHRACAAGYARACDRLSPDGELASPAVREFDRS